MSEIDLGIDGLVEIETIGRGGSAAVYRARQVALDRVVAVKVLMSAWDVDVRRRFDRECRSMGKLSGDIGVVPIYESGETSTGAPYIVMPYYPAGSLQDEMNRNGPFDWREAAQHIKVVAETIAAANNSGVVHRDIKPANLLIGGNGKPRVSDFGIARHIADEQLANHVSTPLFTPAYCSPESFAKNAAAPTVDVYGLGSTFWALVAGHAPFKTKGEKVDMITVFARVANDEVGNLRHLAPDPICALIERTMSKRPEQRPQSAGDFLAELAVAVREADSAPRPTSLAATGAAPSESSIALSSPAESSVAAGSSVFQRRPKRHDAPSSTRNRKAPAGDPHRQKPLSETPQFRRPLTVNQDAPSALSRALNTELWQRHFPKVLIAGVILLLMTTVVLVPVLQRDNASSVEGIREQRNTSTADGDLPRIFGVVTSEVSETSITVKFSTDACTVVSLSGRDLTPARSKGWPDKFSDCANQHRHTFSDLEKGRSYMVAIDAAADGSGVSTESIEFTAGYLAIEGAAVVTNVSPTGATVRFRTSTCTIVEYTGSNLTRFAEAGWPDASRSCTKLHEHRFSGLKPDTSYTTLVTILDLEGRRTKFPVDFLTSAGGFFISDFKVENVTETQATVSFVTSRCSDARFFGSAGSYFEEGWNDEAAACSIRHSYVYNALRPGTEYSVEVEARADDGDQETAKSGSAITFTTSNPKKAPSVSVRVAAQTATSAELAVTSDVCSVVRVVVGGQTFESGNWLDPSAENCSTAHTIELPQLAASKKHVGSVRTKTVEGFESDPTSFSFTTAAKLKVSGVAATVTDQSVAITFDSSACETFKVTLLPVKEIPPEVGSCTDGGGSAVFAAVPTGIYSATVKVSKGLASATDFAKFEVTAIDG